MLFEFAARLRTMPNEEVSYPVNHAIARMLDWLIQHKPEQAGAVVAGDGRRA
ncbi:hypothetical protein [Micromonospora rubida]|uniref:hypothetical protein n=1 Tax=Micromonospora rubida TaxID=2697657 RepID=UPI001376B523|nr:hypothetical protein [Micromonospora rubida]NBE80177.1 hypothetical protein [Micromonospora rubida]